jgi:hypothetical protein
MPMPTNGTSGTGTSTPATGTSGLDIEVLNNGVKLVGEAVVPGASLLLERNVSGGLAMAALGVIGGMAAGSVFGPLGYVLARYGASAASFSQSLEPSPKDAKDDPAAVTAAATTAATTAVMREMRAQQMAPQPSAQATTAAGGGGTVDLAALVAALDRNSDELAKNTRSAARQPAAPRRGRAAA